MNRSDSEEMAGRLLAAGCAEAPSMDAADLVVINTCAIREGAEAKVIGRQGHLARLKAANPGMRVVLTGCSVREPDRGGLGRRYPAVDLFLRPDEEPELVDRLGWPRPRAVDRRDRRDRRRPRLVGRAVVGVADTSSSTRAAGRRRRGHVARSSSISAWLPIIYGCDKTCTYCIVPFSRGPERSRPFDEIVDEARALAAAGYREVTLLGQNVNSYGHDLRARGPVRPRRHRRAGRAASSTSRAGPDLAELIRADRRAAHGRRPAGDPAPAVRHVAPVGPVRPPDRGDGRAARSVCEHLHLPVQSGDDAVLRRMGRQYTIEHYLERLAAIREPPCPGIAISTDVIVGFCGETEAQFEATLAAAGARPLRPGLRGRLLAAARHAGHEARRRRARPSKRRRLNDAARASRRRIGLERNDAWLGRDGRGPRGRGRRRPASHDHDGGRLTTGPATRSQASSPRRADAREQARPPARGSPRCSGREVRVRIDHAGPYALRGRSVEVGRRRDAGPAADRHRRRHGHRQDRASRSGSRERLQAQRPGGEVISADSRQVYRGLDIGTAKVTAAERARVVAPRPRPRRPGRSRSSVADFVTPRAGRARRPRGTRAGSRSSSAGPGF